MYPALKTALSPSCTEIQDSALGSSRKANDAMPQQDILRHGTAHDRVAFSASSAVDSRRTGSPWRATRALMHRSRGGARLLSVAAASSSSVRIKHHAVIIARRGERDIALTHIFAHELGWRSSGEPKPPPPPERSA